MNLSAIRVMVLDDEPFMLKLLARLLTNLGIKQITLCASGCEALTELDTSGSGLDLILCDVNMPEMDGIQFLRQLSTRNFEGSLILVSGEDERVLNAVVKLSHAHHLDVLGNLNKPVRPDLLAALIKRCQRPPPVRARQVSTTYRADELASAINRGELVNCYQPKVDVETGRVVGVEAMVRWRHPRHGLVFPDQFIGLAEQSGLIKQLTQVVITNAFNQARAWREAGLALRIAVNVSMISLDSDEFPDFVEKEAAIQNIAPVDIMLELTESRKMLNPCSSLASLARLRLKRFGLSIDDFGTGYSSLAQLLDLHFDELKIDQGFVRDAWRDEKRRAMYEASLGLANQLGISVVAEGVETRQDWEFLRLTQCRLAQGYFIAKPMLAEELDNWLALWQERVPELLSVTAWNKESS